MLDIDSPVCCAQLPAFLIRCCITVVCMPFVWCVVVTLAWGVRRNEPMLGLRKAIIRPFLKFWCHILLTIGFNYWPSLKGEHPATCHHTPQVIKICTQDTGLRVLPNLQATYTR